jgi:hypothetical protein
MLSHLKDWHLYFPAVGLLAALIFSPALARAVILAELAFSMAFYFRNGIDALSQVSAFLVISGIATSLAVLASKHLPSRIQTFSLAGSQLCLAVLFTASDAQTFAVSVCTFAFLLFILVGLAEEDSNADAGVPALIAGFLLVLSSAMPRTSAPAATLTLLAAALFGPVAPASPALRALLKGRNLPAKLLAVGMGPLVSFWIIKNSSLVASISSPWPLVLASICHLFGAWLAWESRRWSDWIAAATSTTVSFSLLGLFSAPSFEMGPVAGASLCAALLVLVIDWVERQIPEGSLGDGGTLRNVPLASILILLNFAGLLGFPQSPAPTQTWNLASIGIAWGCLSVSGLKLLLPLYLGAPLDRNPPKDIGVIAFVLGLVLSLVAIALRVWNL